MVDNKGNLKQGGINANDKVPPFKWDFGGNDHGSFPGQNWNESIDRNFLIINDCKPSTVPLGTPAVTFAPATCAAINGAVTVGTVDPRVSVVGPTLTGKMWAVSFEKSADTTYTKYVWADGATLSHTFEVLDPTTDPLWDTDKGICRMPDTGAGNIKSENILYAGMLIFAGLALTALVRRRTT